MDVTKLICRNCGLRSLEIQNHHVSGYYIKCIECDFEGPVKQTPEEALQSWQNGKGLQRIKS